MRTDSKISEIDVGEAYKEKYASLEGEVVAKKLPPSLHPKNILRSIIYVQGAVRRMILENRMRRRGLAAAPPGEEVPPPSVYCGITFCRYLLTTKRIDIENEAMGICSLICGREALRPDRWKAVRGLTLGTIHEAHEHYLKFLKETHPVFQLLELRFREVAIDVQEDIVERLKGTTLPSVARARKKEALAEWGAPEKAPGAQPGEDVFPHVTQLIADLSDNVDKIVGTQLQLASTRAALDALTVAIERELTGIHCASRGRCQRAAQVHKEHLETAMQTSFGWPPVGPVPAISRAARNYAWELGFDHIVVEDFTQSVIRERQRLEKKCKAALEHHISDFVELRKQISAEPPLPKLLRDGYQQELDEKVATVDQDELQFFLGQLGYESDVFLDLMLGVLGPDEFVTRIEQEIDSVASELRQLGPFQEPSGILQEPPEQSTDVEARIAAATRLARLLRPLHETGKATIDIEALRNEFAEELASIQPLLKLMEALDEADDDGWHRPPGFSEIDVPFVPPSPPPTPPKSPVKPPTPPAGSGESVKMKIRLHGVTLGDVRCKSEGLVLEQLGDIIAKECKVPRSWLSRIRLVDSSDGDPNLIPNPMLEE